MKKISYETKAAILEAAWRLIAERGRVDVGQGDIAAAAGVSRQSIFYAFGNRTGLLTAMVRHKDATSPRLARLREVGAARRTDAEQLLDVVAAWIDYIPDVYPVATLLDAAATTDPEARAAISDRMVGQLLKGFVARLRAKAERGQIAEGVAPPHPPHAGGGGGRVGAGGSLVVECGLAPDEFKRSRVAFARGFLERDG